MVLRGQHVFEAARRIHELCVQQMVEPPLWSRLFQCEELDPLTPLADRRLIAGYFQDSDPNRLECPLSVKLRCTLAELEKQVMRLAPGDPPVDRRSILRWVYCAMRLTVQAHGSQVCSLPSPTLCSSCSPWPMSAPLLCIVDSWHPVPCPLLLQMCIMEIKADVRLALLWFIFTPCSVFALPLPQERWVEDMLLLVNWATRCGSKVVDLVELLERRSRRRLQLAAFQCIGTLLDDRDLHKVADTLLAEPVCASEGALYDLVTAVCRERWWTWLLLHPDLGPEYIHPANSVFRPLSPCSLCMVSILIQSQQYTRANSELLRRSEVKADVRLD